MNHTLTVKQILSRVDAIAPFAAAEAWDRCGLRLGDENTRVSRVAVVLDASQKAVQMASDNGCELLIAHHPLLFHAAEDLVCDRIDTKVAQTAFRLGVNIVACHTNLDSACSGINHVLAQKAGLKEIVPLLPASVKGAFGMGAIGSVDNLRASELCLRLARAWRLSGYLFQGENESAEKVALCGGAGGEFWKTAREQGATLYATADMRYHERLEALDAGMRLMICDHGEMEDSPLESFVQALEILLELPVQYFPKKLFARGVNEWRSVNDV